MRASLGLEANIRKLGREAAAMTLKTSVSRRAVLAGAAAGSAALAAPAIVSAQAGTLRIGVLLPRSGLLAQAGQSCHRGALAAPRVLAELGYRVELAQVCEQRQVPFVVNIAAAPPITEQGLKFLVRNFQTGPQLVTNGLRLINNLIAATKIDPKRAVFLHANDTFGQAQRNAMDAIFPRTNMPFQLVESIAYDPRAQDLSVEATRLRSLRPDLVLVVTRASDAIKLVRDMVRQRFEPMGIVSPGSPGMYDEEFYQALGPLADFHVSNLPWVNPKSAMTQSLERWFAATNPGNRFAADGFNAGFTFEALLIAADAFKRAGTTSGVPLMEAIRATNLTEHVMIGGPIRFDEKGQNPNIGSACVQNRGRTPVVVLPEDSATMAPVLPMPGWQGRT